MRFHPSQIRRSKLGCVKRHLEQSIDKGRNGRALGQEQQNTRKEQHSHDWDHPPPFAGGEEEEELANGSKTSLGHSKESHLHPPEDTPSELGVARLEAIVGPRQSLLTLLVSITYDEN